MLIRQAGMQGTLRVQVPGKKSARTFQCLCDGTGATPVPLLRLYRDAAMADEVDAVDLTHCVLYTVVPKAGGGNKSAPAPGLALRSVGGAASGTTIALACKDVSDRDAWAAVLVAARGEL